jgi:putative endonuclease
VRLYLVMFYVYCLRSKKDRHQLYFGYSSDLKRRLIEHNKGLSDYTKIYRPWEIIYYEACINKSDAERREKYLKTNVGRRMFKRRLKDYFKESLK